MTPDYVSGLPKLEIPPSAPRMWLHPSCHLPSKGGLFAWCCYQPLEFSNLWLYDTHISWKAGHHFPKLVVLELLLLWTDLFTLCSDCGGTTYVLFTELPSHGTKHWWQSYTRLNRMDGPNVFKHWQTSMSMTRQPLCRFTWVKLNSCFRTFGQQVYTILWTYPWSSLRCQEYYQLVFEDSWLGRSQKVHLSKQVDQLAPKIWSHEVHRLWTSGDFFLLQDLLRMKSRNRKCWILTGKTRK